MSLTRPVGSKRRSAKTAGCRGVVKKRSGTGSGKAAHTYLSTTDLADRWGYSSRWVRELVAARDFPEPAFAVSRGLIPIWSLDDVEAWESRNDPTLNHNRRLAAQQPSSPRRRRSSYTPPLGATYEQRVTFYRELFRQRRVRQKARTRSI